ncbi:hypothetical protein FB107DRAFT_267122 [Schizophyllum commune]
MKYLLVFLILACFAQLASALYLPWQTPGAHTRPLHIATRRRASEGRAMPSLRRRSHRPLLFSSQHPDGRAREAQATTGMRTLDATLALMSEDVSSTYEPSIPLDARADRPPPALISDAIADDSHHRSEHPHDPTMNSSSKIPYAP